MYNLLRLDYTGDATTGSQELYLSEGIYLVKIIDNESLRIRYTSFVVCTNLESFETKLYIDENYGGLNIAFSGYTIHINSAYGYLIRLYKLCDK